MANKDTSNPGNFANDRQKASDAGKKGGQASGGTAGGQTRKPDMGDKPGMGNKTDRKPSGGGRS
ncbi:general stress protein [Pseudomonas sp. GD03860]|uniref:KGG domain-containing protein n=1 Tax=Pseudomonas TaxID=286 RepID=UPI002363BA9C|nr:MULTISPECIES: KGG domain-containing protein [Pseudomonas]MDD2058719.1 general stress protein [Pseudomonas putida]MDH0636952.1 general stress protein [Pseudomonas sp. GD03860]